MFHGVHTGVNHFTYTFNFKLPGIGWCVYEFFADEYVRRATGEGPPRSFHFQGFYNNYHFLGLFLRQGSSLFHGGLTLLFRDRDTFMLLRSTPSRLRLMLYETIYLLFQQT